jgi:hypothetical protein
LDLEEARREGRLFDPAAEGFVARRRLRRKVADIEYSASEYLYSHHQMLLLPLLRAARPYLRTSRSGDLAHLEVSKWWRTYAVGRAMQLREVTIALSALEAVYYPRIVRRLSYSTEYEYERYMQWVRRLGIRRMLGWLDVDANWLKDTGAALLDMADNIDPLGEWLDVVREAHPDRWKKLKGEARNAIDMRIGAEMFLRYYEDLAQRRQAKPLEQRIGRWRGPFDSRLKPQGGLDRVLTAFDLSPHPSLVLVVEGATELTIVPRVMAMFGIRTDEDFISVQDAGGVGRDLNSLVAYALAPRIDAEEQGEYLALARPPSCLFAIMDAERPMATAAAREKRRKGWVERILLSIPAAYRTDEVRRNLDGMVEVGTWNRRGESFEFSHFTDRQLVTATAGLDTRSRQPSTIERAKIIARLRATGGNLETLLGGASKVRLADALWPVLEKRIQRAEERGTADRIPVVRALDRATDLARLWPRSNVVIPLRSK